MTKASWRSIKFLAAHYRVRLCGLHLHIVARQLPVRMHMPGGVLNPQKHVCGASPLSVVACCGLLVNTCCSKMHEMFAEHKSV